MKNQSSRYYISFSTILISLFFISSVFSANPEGKPPKYIFLFIGDGMGLAQTSITEAYLASLNGSIGMSKLAMNTFPVQGIASTFAANRLITCSAAAGTALASGQKTSINTIGKNEDRTKPLFSISTRAKEAGMKVGLISSVGLNHATPAAFYAHQDDRNIYYEIAGEMTSSGVDFFGGGGIMEPKGKKNDQPDAWEIVKNAGYKRIDNKKDFSKLKPGDGKVFVVNPNLDDEWAMPFTIDARPEDFSLAEITAKAIELLNNPNGFFMMVEGGKIDWACHGNDAAAMMGEVIAFDEAIQKAIEFYKKHPDETLIVVTADHETGGLALGNANMKYDSDLALFQNQKTSSQVFGKETGKFLNSIDTVDGFRKALDFLNDKLGLGSKITLTGLDSLHLFQAYQASVLKKMPFSFNEDNYALYGGGQPFAIAAIKVIARKAGVGWTTWSHTLIPVPVRAIGAGSELFDGYIDNVEIPLFISKLLKINLN